MIPDIVNVYPFISEELHDECLAWAEDFIHKQPIEYETVMHSRRTI